MTLPVLFLILLSGKDAKLKEAEALSLLAELKTEMEQLGAAREGVGLYSIANITGQLEE